MATSARARAQIAANIARASKKAKVQTRTVSRGRGSSPSRVTVRTPVRAPVRAPVRSAPAADRHSNNAAQVAAIKAAPVIKTQAQINNQKNTDKYELLSFPSVNEYGETARERQIRTNAGGPDQAYADALNASRAQPVSSGGGGGGKGGSDGGGSNGGTYNVKRPQYGFHSNPELDANAEAGFGQGRQFVARHHNIGQPQRRTIELFNSNNKG